MSFASARTDHLLALRAEVRAIETSIAGRGPAECRPFGVAVIDERLAGGGLAATALHEVAAAEPGLGHDAAATLFTAGIAGRQAESGEATVLWALSRRDLFAPGLAQAGLPPGRVIYAECRRDEDVLAVMEEGLRHGGLAAVIGEVGRAGMAATRRLQLAAEEGGTMALMLRQWRRSGSDPLAMPSAAVTRWRLGCVPSAKLAVPGLGRARWSVELARQRGGEPFTLIMEACDAEGRLALPAEPADRSAAPAGAAPARRAA